jgi:hypothetical protein
MRQYQIYASIFALLVTCIEAKAGDKEDVMAKVSSWSTLLAAGDIEALEITPHTRFSGNGGLLSIVNPKQVKAWLSSSGVKINTHRLREENTHSQAGPVLRGHAIFKSPTVI